MAFLTYRVSKDRLKIGKYIEISEKAGLDIMWLGTEYFEEEVIQFTNSGSLPIDEFKAKFDLLITSKNSSNILLEYEWECDSVLNPKESAIIDLSKRLRPILYEHNLMKMTEVDVPNTEKDGYGEYIWEKMSVRHLVEPFSLTMKIS